MQLRKAVISGFYFLTLLALGFLRPLSMQAADNSAPGMKKKGVPIGSLAPEFAFQDSKGDWIALSDFRSKKVFIFSWSTWCRCKEQLPDLEKFWKQYQSDKFQVLTVASDSQGFKWVQQYLDLAGATYITVVDPNNELGKKYNFWATENGWLIDEGGIVRMNAINFDIRNPAQKEELVKLMKTDFSAAAQKGQKVTLADRVKSAQDSLAKNPRDFSKKLELAELFRQQGDYQAAEKSLRGALKQKPLSAEAHYRLGVVLCQKGEVEAGVREWEKAFQIEPTNYLYMRNIQAYRDPRKFYAEMINK
jgi:cytochrome c biogenesis protein CcmG, thiol:disulfide interchange protein DsbE